MSIADAKSFFTTIINNKTANDDGRKQFKDTCDYYQRLLVASKPSGYWQTQYCLYQIDYTNKQLTALKQLDQNHPLPLDQARVGLDQKILPLFINGWTIVIEP
jgi:hypothetical protein